VISCSFFTVTIG